MPKTQQETMTAAEEARHDRTVEERKSDRQTEQAARSSRARVASALPNLPNQPGSRPGGLAEAMANPVALQQSLDATRQRREDYEDAKVKAGIKDVRRPGNTPANKVNFAEGMAAKPGEKITLNKNPRFENPQPLAAVDAVFPKSSKAKKK